MKRLLFASGLLASGVLFVGGVSLGHGGTYRGPGDTVPPGGSGPGPGTPGPTGPTAPGPAGPTTPGATNPGPATGPATPGVTGGVTGPRTGAALDLGPPLELWQFWWEFNKDPFLNLKSRIHGPSVVTGSDDFFLGRVDRKDVKDTLKPSEQQIRGEIVPMLLETLKKENKREILDSSLIALAKIGGDDAFIDAIAPFLKDGNQTLVETAAVALGILARPKAFPMLKDLVLDSPKGREYVGRNEVPYRVRAFATYGLGLLANAERETAKEVGTTLRNLLADDRSSWKDVRVAAAISLGLFDDPENQSLPALEKYFENPENDSLVRAHTPVSIAKILNKKDNPQQEVERFVERFRKSLEARKEDDRVRESCVVALGLLTNSTSGHYGAVLASLANQIQDGREQARNFSAIALAEAGGADAVTLLRRSLARGKSTFQPWAGLALGVLCHRARAGNQPIPDREGILEDLKRAMVSEGSPEYSACYALALGLAGDVSARETIVKKMERVSEEDSRGYYCLALGLLGASESRELLHQEVKNAIRKPNLLKQAAIGLGLLSDRNAVPELLKILREEKTLAVQAAVATALGFIGDSRSIPDLVAMMKDTSLTDFARGFAAVALGIIADKEELPWNSKIAVSVNYRAFVRTLVGAGLSPGILDIL